ncbi:MAG: cyanophycin synthetase [Nibricoccus sp.]
MPVPGRLEAVPAQRQFSIFVDYAHTDDALLNVIKTCRELNPARLIVVFGCGGNRDKTKRPRMGAVVDQYADYAIVTSDNPRKEDPQAIIDDIKPGHERGNYEVIVDRSEAIFKAVAMAQTAGHHAHRGQGPRDLSGICRPYRSLRRRRSGA